MTRLAPAIIQRTPHPSTRLVLSAPFTLTKHPRLHNVAAGRPAPRRAPRLGGDAACFVAVPPALRQRYLRQLRALRLLRVKTSELFFSGVD